MNGSTHVMKGSGDHTTQKGKRPALASIDAEREPPAIPEFGGIVLS